MTATKSVWIPASYTQIIETDLGIVHHDGARYAIAHKKKNGQASGKSVWHFSFKNAERIADKAATWLKELDQVAAYKADQKAQTAQRQKDFAEQVKVGDIFYSSWGYEQTNVDFYQVTSKSGCFVKLRELDSKLTDSETGGSMSGYVVPVIGPAPEKFTETRHKLGAGHIRFSSFNSASIWDGKPKYTSWYG